MVFLHQRSQPSRLGRHALQTLQKCLMLSHPGVLKEILGIVKYISKLEAKVVALEMKPASTLNLRFVLDQ